MPDMSVKYIVKVGYFWLGFHLKVLVVCITKCTGQYLTATLESDRTLYYSTGLAALLPLVVIR